ncbi:MAG: hypothetical protein R6V73_05895 [Anaerolineales bacterium]|jgi:hypothetical protein
MQNLDGLWGLLLLLGPLLLLQRRLHHETQAIFLLLTRRGDLALVLFSVLFFPGVLLHEASHFAMARLLGVRTGRFSVLPRALPGGRLQLGFVETASVDIFRDALIGLAPLLAGGLFVAYAGYYRLGLPGAWESLVNGSSGLLSILNELHLKPDFWLWFYLTFAVSSTMLPSPSDRHAWLPLVIVAIVLLLVSFFVGAGPWLLANLASPFNQALRSVAMIFGIATGIHFVLLPPLWLMRQGLMKATGYRVV